MILYTAPGGCILLTILLYFLSILHIQRQYWKYWGIELVSSNIIQFIKYSLRTQIYFIDIIGVKDRNIQGLYFKIMFNESHVNTFYLKSKLNIIFQNNFQFKSWTILVISRRYFRSKYLTN